MVGKRRRRNSRAREDFGSQIREFWGFGNILDVKHQEFWGFGIFRVSNTRNFGDLGIFWMSNTGNFEDLGIFRPRIRERPSPQPGIPPGNPEQIREFRDASGPQNRRKRPRNRRDRELPAGKAGKEVGRTRSEGGAGNGAGDTPGILQAGIPASDTPEMLPAGIPAPNSSSGDTQGRNSDLGGYPGDTPGILWGYSGLDL